MIDWTSFLLGAAGASLVWSIILSVRMAAPLVVWHLTGKIFQRSLVHFGKDTDEKTIPIEINEN